jgi:hypothetical protein
MEVDYTAQNDKEIKDYLTKKLIAVKERYGFVLYNR